MEGRKVLRFVQCIRMLGGGIKASGPISILDEITNGSALFVLFRQPRAAQNGYIYIHTHINTLYCRYKHTTLILSLMSDLTHIFP